MPMVKYIKSPTTSFRVVINGPVARAGSILYLLRSRGMRVPNMAATKMTANKEILTTKPKVEFPKAKAMAKAKAAAEAANGFSVLPLTALNNGFDKFVVPDIKFIYITCIVL